MSSENSSFNEEKEQKSINKEFFQKNPEKSMNEIEDKQINNSLIKIEINLGENNIKELNISSLNNLDQSIKNFCKENNISKDAESTIKKLLMDELNKKIEQCK